ncbi:membrane-associated transporter protein-like isoform X2 [Glandiceps talaboti]
MDRVRDDDDDDDDTFVYRPRLERSLSNPEGHEKERHRHCNIFRGKRGRRKHSLTIAHKSVKNAVIPSMLVPRKTRCKSLERPSIAHGTDEGHQQHSVKTPTIPEEGILQSNMDVGEDESEDDDDDDEPPKRSLCELLTNNAIAFGVEVCYATETALVMPILLRIGLPDELYSLTWVVSPVLGLIFQPLIGSASDRCTCFWGQRRPFLLGLCIGIILGLSLLLNGGDIGKAINQQDNVGGIVLTLVGVVMLDFCADSSDSPARAYMIDVCNSNDLEKGLNIHALLGGIGGGIGYIVAGINWDNTELGKVLGGHNRVVFIFTIIVCMITFTLTLFSIKEEPLKSRTSYEKDIVDQSILHDSRSNPHYGSINSTTTLEEGDNDMEPCGYRYTLSHNSFQSTPCSHTENDDGIKPVFEDSLKGSNISGVSNSLEVNDVITGVAKSMTAIEKSVENMEDAVNTIQITVNHLEASVKSLQDFASGSSYQRTPVDNEVPTNFSNSSSSSTSEQQASSWQLIKSIIWMPGVLRRLCVNHFLGWFAFVPILLFFTDYVGQVVYQGDPKALLNSTERQHYDDGVKMGCWGLCIFAFSAAIYSLIFSRLINYISYCTAYVAGELLFAIATGLMAVFNDSIYVTLGMCPFLGVMFTTITTLPFAILAEFHENDSTELAGQT